MIKCKYCGDNTSNSSGLCDDCEEMLEETEKEK